MDLTKQRLRTGTRASRRLRTAELHRLLLLVLIGLLLAGALRVTPPPGLTQAGWAALLVMATAVLLWSLDLWPSGATALLAMALLVMTGAARDLPSGLGGLSRPTVV